MKHRYSGVFVYAMALCIAQIVYCDAALYAEWHKAYKPYVVKELNDPYIPSHYSHTNSLPAEVVAFLKAKQSQPPEGWTLQTNALGEWGLIEPSGRRCMWEFRTRGEAVNYAEVVEREDRLDKIRETAWVDAQ